MLNLDYNPLGTSTTNTLMTLPLHVLVLVLSVLSLSVLVLSPGDQIAGMLAVAVASSRTLEVLDLEGTGLTNQSAQVDQSHGSISLILLLLLLPRLLLPPLSVSLLLLPMSFFFFSLVVLKDCGSELSEYAHCSVSWSSLSSRRRH